MTEGRGRRRRRARAAFRRGYEAGKRAALRVAKPRTVPGKLAVASSVVVGTIMLLFAIAGFPHFFRTTPVRDVTLAVEGGQLPDVGSPGFATLFEQVTGASLTVGGRAEILLDGLGLFPRLWSDLGAAEHSIAIIEYYAKPGAVADSLAAILRDRAGAGVDVRILFDAFGSAGLPETYLTALNGAGAHAAWYRPLRWYALDRAGHRTHVRAVVIDDSLAYTGGFGFDDHWLGGGAAPDEWRETNVRFTGPAVAQLQADFVAHWADATGELLLATGHSSQTRGQVEYAPIRSALLRSPAAVGGVAAERLLAFAVRTARNSLFITNAYFVPDHDFVRMLADAATRGVDVRVLTNGERTDVKIALLAGRSRYRPLLDAGVRIFEYEPTVMHAKTMVVDGALVAIGTINFDNRSLAYNNEVSFIAVDQEMGARMESIFADDMTRSREIRRDDFDRRGVVSKFMELIASALSGFL